MLRQMRWTLIRPAEEAREALEAEALDVEALEALQAVELGKMTQPPSTHLPVPGVPRGRLTKNRGRQV